MKAMFFMLPSVSLFLKFTPRLSNLAHAFSISGTVIAM
jgi:hypothetical protein